MNNNVRSTDSPDHDTPVSPASEQVWLLTGVTGFIGREVLRRVLSRPHARVVALVRPRGGRSAQARVRQVLDSLYGDRAKRYAARVQTVSADLASERLGLTAGEWACLARVSHIVHMAARTRFDGSIDAARRHNVGAVEQLLQVAHAARDAGMLQRFVHVSTAYVAGDTTDTVGPERLEPQGPFRNVYERSKAEAEALVRASANHLPTVIFRPSIVIGDSRSGEVANFNTIYWAIKTYLRGQRVMFANTQAPLDLVPVDYVADAMMYLAIQPESVGRTFHLAAGSGAMVRLGDFASAVTAYFDGPALTALPPRSFCVVRAAARFGLVPRRMRAMVANAGAYLPYFSNNPTFDVSATEAALASSGIRVPRLETYLENILEHCLERGLGVGSPMLNRQRRRCVPIAGASCTQQAIGGGR